SARPARSSRRARPCRPGAGRRRPRSSHDRLSPDRLVAVLRLLVGVEHDDAAVGAKDDAVLPALLLQAADRQQLAAAAAARHLVDLAVRGHADLPCRSSARSPSVAAASTTPSALTTTP